MSLPRLSAAAQVNLVAAFLAVVLALLALPACGEPERPAMPAMDPPVLPAPPATRPQAATPEEAERRAARAALAQAQARVEAAEASVREARQEASLAPLRATATWATWAGGIVALLGGTLALVSLIPGSPLTFGWKQWIGLSLAGLALASCAQALMAIAPWLVLVGLALLGLAVLAALGWVVWRLVRDTADHADRLEATAVQAGIPLAHLRQQVHQVSASRPTAPLIDIIRGKRRKPTP